MSKLPNNGALEDSLSNSKLVNSFSFNEVCFVLLESIKSSEGIPRGCDYCNSEIEANAKAFVIVANHHLNDDEISVDSDAFLVCESCYSSDIEIELLMSLIEITLTNENGELK